jgi:hypothetical protein
VNFCRSILYEAETARETKSKPPQVNASAKAAKKRITSTQSHTSCRPSSHETNLQQRRYFLLQERMTLNTLKGQVRRLEQVEVLRHSVNLWEQHITINFFSSPNVPLAHISRSRAWTTLLKQLSSKTSKWEVLTISSRHYCDCGAHFRVQSGGKADTKLDLDIGAVWYCKTKLAEKVDLEELNFDFPLIDLTLVPLVDLTVVPLVDLTVVPIVDLTNLSDDDEFASP